MTIPEILGLPMNSMMAKDSALFLWTTNSHFPIAFEAIQKWKLRYITTLTWVKPRFGLGYWLRGQTEHALLAVKGNPRSKLKGPNGAMAGKAWSTVIHAPLGKHSEKPGIVYTMVEDMFPGPYLELFCRMRRQGWDAWGNEMDDHSQVQQLLMEDGP
jgi:N6-adenosine-specific RNA methylase IME4